VFALSSVFEGLPNVLIQAMAVRTPVVATDCKSGPREILEDGRHGMLVPVRDPDALAAAIEETLRAGFERPDVLPDHLKRFELNAIVSQYLEALLGEDGMAAEEPEEAREVSGVGVR